MPSSFYISRKATTNIGELHCHPVWHVQAGKKLLTGHIDLVNFSVPVKMFEPRSYLEKLADVWVYPRIIAQAADTADPVKRMKLVITW